MKRIVCVAILAIAATGCPKAPKVTVATQPPVDDRNTNYKPGAGAIVNSARAGKRVAALNDFEQLKTFIFAFELDNNRMPTKDELRAELKTAANLLKLIDDGAILLPTQLRKDGVWAYEVDADKAGGIMIVAGNVMRVISADDVKKYLGQ
jgi:hypothetical protein